MKNHKLRNEEEPRAYRDVSRDGQLGPQSDERNLRIFWHENNSGLLHACEAVDVHPGAVLVWTLCQKDVPPGWEIFARSEKPKCPDCLKYWPDKPLPRSRKAARRTKVSKDDLRLRWRA